jgi:SAM-dependent methyltransferase
MTKLTTDDINAIIACPTCKHPIRLVEGEDVACRRCQERYRWISGTWDTIPSSYTSSSNLWPAWEQLQANGLVSYRHDPENNLAVGDRNDCVEFSRFCRFDGLVLDVGCGPQRWPAYFRFRSDRTRFVGVDPLIQGSGADYLQLRALSEFLPFRDHVFDHAVFATSLDHFLHPAGALLEARRVCRLGGEIDIWNGEKQSDAPRSALTHEWYASLKTPEGAEDVFHFRRLHSSELKTLFSEVSLSVIEEQIYRVDEFRRSCFYRLKID